jgi:hypothetical protein
VSSDLNIQVRLKKRLIYSHITVISFGFKTISTLCFVQFSIVNHIRAFITTSYKLADSLIGLVKVYRGFV